ncbi:regulatory protein RecX [Corynebacterium pseudopelargi]|uniref:Regulatory protein RecX n=1 Tax=Corynebacterium pseudopelargi TaxID=2080757 RepID=A0A3G6ITN1_9CORY|nr:regulatory protein RecX [Corynebacterium pseudopelargi]AZA09089.1 Regulatory protein RecX [Corynebacterium pseudopelargi]
MATFEERMATVQAAFEDYERNGSELFDVPREEHKAKVRHRALLLLDQRARSRHELQQRLLALEFDAALVDEVLDDLTKSKLLDDATFAKEWVRQRHERRGKSRTVLNRELITKGVPEHLRHEALDQIDQESEDALAWRLAQKKARSIKSIPTSRAEYDKNLRRILGVLARRGFQESAAFGIAKQSLEQRIEQLREQA